MQDVFTRKQEYMSMAQLGVAAYIKATQPTKDKINRSEAVRWIDMILKEWGQKKIHPEPYLLDMERRGLIKGVRERASKRSPIYYSRLEIQSALQAIKNSYDEK